MSIYVCLEERLVSFIRLLFQVSYVLEYYLGNKWMLDQYPIPYFL